MAIIGARLVGELIDEIESTDVGKATARIITALVLALIVACLIAVSTALSWIEW
jgi:hypothetical protein